MPPRGLRGTGTFPGASPGGPTGGSPGAVTLPASGFSVSGAAIQNRAGRLGRIAPQPAGIVPGSPRNSTPRTPIIDLERGYQVEPAYFHVAVLQSGVTFPTGTAAWYGMRRIRVTEDIGQDITLAGINGSILPADVAGAGVSVTDAGTARAWGDATGMTAAIVIGRNLPITAGGWTAAAAYLPGILLGINTPPAYTRTSAAPGAPEYLAVVSFPTGQLTDTAPNKMPVAIDFAGHTKRIYVGQTLDVALVMKAGYVSGLTGYVGGFVYLGLTIGQTFATPTRS